MREKKVSAKENKVALTGFLLFTATILYAVVAVKLLPQKIDIVIKSFAITIVMLVIVWVGIQVHEFKPIDEKRKRQLFLICYCLSLCFAALSGTFPVYTLWMIGGVWISAYLNVSLGLAIHFIFTYFVCSLGQDTIETFLCYFVVGAVMCFLGAYCNKMITFVYTTIITISCQIVLQFIIHSFILQQSVSINNVYSIGTTVVILGTTYLGFQYGKEKMDWLLELEQVHKDSKKNKIVLEKIDNTIEKEECVPVKDYYQVILSEEFELLERLKRESTVLYLHSIKVAEISEKAAAAIGCNAKAARAGGLYHEIGKLEGKNYIEEGIALAAKYKFPDEVITVIKQHNSKFEKPKSKEAAVVMLTESIVSTISYFEHEKKMARKEGREFREQPVSKIVENIINIRFAKGTLDESGISIAEFNQLKSYYIEYYSV